uniref:Uncharacterized protein n=1 Tax=Salix viminalis TaxID=40686 RepID=A0A6N2N663_SALVM
MNYKNRHHILFKKDHQHGPSGLAKVSIASSSPSKKTEGERHEGEPLLISFSSLLSSLLDKLLLQPLKVMMSA